MGLLKEKYKQEQEKAERDARKAQTATIEKPSVIRAPSKIADMPPVQVFTPTKAIIVPRPAPVALPTGYYHLSKHQEYELDAYLDKMGQAERFAFDFETDRDADTIASTMQARIVGMSASYEAGTALYLPMGHDPYAANWDEDVILRKFEPYWGAEELVKIAHNKSYEYMILWLRGIRFRGLFADPMIMAKQLARFIGETGEEELGLKKLVGDVLGIPPEKVRKFTDVVGTKEIPVEPPEVYKSGPKKGQLKTQEVQRTFNELPVDQSTVDYGCGDSDWALQLYDIFKPELQELDAWDVLESLDMPFLECLSEVMLTGWHISTDQLEVLGNLAHDKIDEITPRFEIELRRAAGVLSDEDCDLLTEALGEGRAEEVMEELAEYPVIVPAGNYLMATRNDRDIFLKIKTAKPFKFNSPQHKPWLFFHVLKANPTKFSKDTGLPSCDGKVIDSLIEKYGNEVPFFKVLKELSKFEKIRSTYIEGKKAVGTNYDPETHRVHSSLRLVETWRLASKTPNLQNIPRADNDPFGIRSLFVAPTIYIPGKAPRERVLVSADYSQIELKVLAWYAQDANMIDAFVKGQDLHSRVAKEVFKLPCTVEQVKDLYKPQRYRSKKVNFGLVYGMTEYGLSSDPDMHMSLQEAKQFIDNYMATFPGVRKYADDQIAFARVNGYNETMFGHRRPNPDINHPNKWIRQHAENVAMNTPIQGSAADIIKIAMVALWQEYWEHGGSIGIPQADLPNWFNLVMQIHDELQVETYAEYALAACKFLKYVMERPIDGFNVPIIAEPAIGKSWSTAVDVEWEGDKAWGYVKIAKQEATDVTVLEIAPYKHLYDLAGVELRVKDNRDKKNTVKMTWDEGFELSLPF